ncbi:hypothetical protein FRC01_010359, partial [Tulasnella sp. 417]
DLGMALSAASAPSTDFTNEQGVIATNSGPPVVASQTPSAPAAAQSQPVVPKSSSKREKSLSAIKTTLGTVEAVSGAIPVVGSYVAAAAKVGGTIVQMVQNMDSNEEVAKDLKGHAAHLSEVLNNFRNKSVQQQKELMTAYMNDVQQELQSLQGKLEEMESSSTFSKAFFSGDRGKVLMEYKENSRTAVEVMQVRDPHFDRATRVNLISPEQVLGNLNATSLLTELYNAEIRKENRRLLDRLGDAKYGIRGAAIEDAICLPNTRVQLLKRINTWVRSREPSNRVLWIRGMAGRGKSTIASTIAHQWRFNAACAIFHFRRGQNGSDTSLVCALARQLGSGNLVPEVKGSILNTVAENEDIRDERLQQQFLKLFVTSLGQTSCARVPILLIVDALDECENVNFAVTFVKLIGTHSSTLPANVKFLLTTRPEAPLLRALEPMQWHTEDLDSITDMHDDIGQFFKHQFLKIREEFGNLDDDWPPLGDVQALVDASQGLFQWAHTVIEYMISGSPQHRLQELLASPLKFEGLDTLYVELLSKAYAQAKGGPGRQDVLLRMLGTLVVAPYPISLETFAFLFADHPFFRNESQENIVGLICREILVNLRSLIHVPDAPTDPIRFMHTSVRDLLINKERCGGKQYFIDTIRENHDLAMKCLQLMERDLKTNICRLSDLSKANSDPGIQELVKLQVPQGLQYSCRSWFFHLTADSPEVTSGCQRTTSDIESFSQGRLLGWLEVMSLIGETRQSLAIAKQVHLWLQSSDVTNNPVTLLWSDMARFINIFFEPISFGALHIYASALPFCPTNTSLWPQYSNLALTRVLNGPRPLIWPLEKWSKHTTAAVKAIHFSHHDGVIACALDDMTIQLLDAETGVLVGKPLCGHSGQVNAVAFSPDGKLLVSGSSDSMIQLWDAKTQAPIGEPLCGHQNQVNAVAFSPDGKFIVSGSSDTTIQVWDIKTRAPVGGPLCSEGKVVNAVAFSPDGTFLVSGMRKRLNCPKEQRNNTIQIWDAQTGTPVGNTAHKDPSEDGKLYYRFWQGDHSIREGDLVENSDNSQVNAVAFSPDGKFIVSGSSDKIVQLWDAKTATPVGQPLYGHKSPVNAVAFSPDGNLIVSGSSDTTIRVWDAKTRAPVREPLRGHDKRVNAVAFCPEGKFIVSGSSDSTIRLWAVQGETSAGGPLCGHDSQVNTVAFSPDGMLLASGSGSVPLLGSSPLAYDVPTDNTIRLWDTKTQAPVGKPLCGHTSQVNAVAFSADGKFLVSGSSDTTIQLWDIKTRAPAGSPLQGHDSQVNAVAFSVDGEFLVSGSADTTIRLWNAKTGAPIGKPLYGHTSQVNAVAFSADGRFLVSGSSDTTIQLWDAKTQAPVREPLQGHTSLVNSVAFSTDGKFLASGSSDTTIQLWDVKTGTPLGEPLQGHGSHVNAVAFSPDGKFLVSGSSDATIRLWDTEAQAPVGEPVQGHGSSVNAVAFSPDGTILVSGSSDTMIQLWDAKTRAPIGEPLQVHGRLVNTVACSPDGTLVASGSGSHFDIGQSGNTICLWDAKTGAPVGHPLQHHLRPVNAIAFSPDGKLLVSGSSDTTIQIWDTKIRAPIGEPLQGHQSQVNTIAFSPDGTLLASGSGSTLLFNIGPSDNTIRLWDPETGTPIGDSLQGHHKSVNAVAFSPNGKLLVSGSSDMTIRLWDTKTGAPVEVPLQGHHRPVNAVAFSRGGKVLVSGSSDAMIRLWDAKTRAPLSELLNGHAGPVNLLAFSLDGRFDFYQAKILACVPDP